MRSPGKTCDNMNLFFIFILGGKIGMSGVYLTLSALSAYVTIGGPTTALTKTFRWESIVLIKFKICNFMTQIKHKKPIECTLQSLNNESSLVENMENVF